MSVPSRLNLTLYDWSSARHRVHLVDADGEAHDLGNYRAEMQLRDEPGGELLLELTEGQGVDTHAEGYVDISFDGDTIGEAPWLSALYDLWLVDILSQRRYAVATGTILVRPSVSSFEV